MYIVLYPMKNYGSNWSRHCSLLFILVTATLSEERWLLLVASAGELRAVAETQLRPASSEALGKHGLYKEITVFKKTQNKTIISCTDFHLTRGENSSINNKSKQSTQNLFHSSRCLFRVGAKKNSCRKISFEPSVGLDFSALPRIPTPPSWPGKHSFPLLSPGVRFPLALNIQYLP